ncbi:phage head closure protein [Hyphomicrobium sp. D-2]|uniref:phage head closure protein n=1 Tax=Hyphomicrobium sp. D-2 TaxID=3041621 RepID=UPI002458C342|nr:phage head closure protein [Hyphomicrobium sp. D-2]MDH4981298.1 phage head closure protein [Hyphomicrobium sp. D-2]
MAEFDIGDLRTRASIETSTSTDDGGGGRAVVWTKLADIWAYVRATTGSENFAHDRLSGSVSHEIVMRHRADVTPGMRIIVGTRVFEIRAVFDPDGRRRWTRCLAQERDL